MAAIHQFVAGFARGDAISNEAVKLRAMFRSWGFQSELFCEAKRILPQLRREAHDVSSFAGTARPDDIVLLHLSIGSVVNDIFATLKCRRAIMYHNITPPQYFRPLQKQITLSLERGLDQARMLAGKADVVMAVSKFNAGELQKMGHGRVEVLPIVLDFDTLAAAPDSGAMRRFGDGLVNVIFVGRCVPNKRIEDLLMAFSVFQKSVEPQSRFVHVGSHAGLERYYCLLFTLARDLGLRNVHFAGSLPLPQLNACYRCASIFLCMSEHEGFCIPLIESMYHGVPVLAYAAAAVPETLDGAGVLFKEKKFDMIAEMMGRLAHDTDLRTAVVARQNERIERYRARDLAAELRRHLAPILPAS